MLGFFVCDGNAEQKYRPPRGFFKLPHGAFFMSNDNIRPVAVPELYAYAVYRKTKSTGGVPEGLPFFSKTPLDWLTGATQQKNCHRGLQQRRWAEEAASPKLKMRLVF